MREIKIEIIGGSAGEIFDSASPTEGDSKQIGDGVEVEYKSDVAAKSAEGDAFLLIVRQTTDFVEFAIKSAAWEVVRRNGPKAVRVAGKGVEVKREEIQKRVEEVLEDD